MIPRMAKKSGTGRPGRPPAENPKDVQLRVRLDKTVGGALDAYRDKHYIGDRSEAVRHIIVRVLKEDGLLK